MELRDAPGWRRLAAFGCDYGVLAGYITLLTAASFAAQRSLGIEVGPPATLRGRLLGQAMGMLVLTLPTTLYFAWFEAANGATLGKRALGLRVVAQDGGRVQFGRSLARSAVKFAPWELAHTMLWHTPGWPTQPTPTSWNWAGFALSLALSVWYALALFGMSRRTPYDRIAGTRVVLAR